MSHPGPLHRAIAIDEFAPMVGQTLIAECNPRPVELVLASLHPYPRRMSARIPFTLVFRSSVDVQLVAGMYSLRCGDFGPEIIYLEPMMPPRERVPGNYYQAVFN